jgi:hypothetical protein
MAILTAPAPRASDGKPDLSGVWHVHGESIEEKRRIFGPDVGKIFTIGMEPETVSKYAINVLLGYTPGEIVMTPDAETIYRRRTQGQEYLTTAHCQPAGTPLATLLSEAFKIVQTPGLTLVIHELDGFPRQIYTDGRSLPKDPLSSWLGYSIGRWQGDTLVVDTIGFNDRTWLVARGHPHSEAMHMTEQYQRPDVSHLNVEITIDDPKSYNKPFTFKVTHLLEVDSDIMEYICTEGERDREHMVK